MFSKLPLTALKAFEAAARLSSFKQAAAELAVSPSAVSHQVKALEQGIGQQLFERVAKGAVLTPVGATLFAQVHRHFSGLEDALAHYRPSADNQDLVITTTQAFAALWLIPRLGRFYARHPGISVKVEAINSVVDLLREGHVDIAIRNASGGYPDLYERPLMAERFGVYIAVQASAAQVMDELIDVAWAAPQTAIVQWQQWCEQAGTLSWLLDYKIRHYEDEHYALQAAVAGQGYILASDVLAQDSVNRGLLTPYRPEVVLEGYRYIALCRPGKERTPAVRCFLDWAADEAHCTP